MSHPNDARDDGGGSGLDLGTLARRENATIEFRRSGKRHWWIPIVVLAALTAALARPLMEALGPRIPVRIVRPVRAEKHALPSAGAALLSTSGFVEPEPAPLRITALAPGVIREVLVQPGDAVAVDQVVARLVDDEARLARDRAVANLAGAEADRKDAAARASAARAAFDANLEWTAAIESATADLAEAVADEAAADAAIAVASGTLAAADAELELDRKLASQAGTGSIELRIAEAERARALAAIDAATATRAAAVAATARARAVLTRVTAGAKLRLAEVEHVATTRAAEERANANIAAARVELDAATLVLTRMEVRAPAAGIVYEHGAAQGDRVGDPESPPLFALFAADQVRVRADVPQQDAFKITLGMRARITLDGSDLTLDGEVVRHLPYADLTKSTIPVHVKPATTDVRLVPDLLVRVQFLAPHDADADAAVGGAVVIPRSALRDERTVFVVDAEDRARTRAITPIGRVGDDAITVGEGLNVADRVVTDPPPSLGDGDRVDAASGGP